MFKRLFCWAYFRGSLFSEGLNIGGNFVFQNGWDLTIKTASTNSPWAYIREGLLSEIYLRFGGLSFGRAYFWGGTGRLIIGILRYQTMRNALLGLYFSFTSFFTTINQSSQLLDPEGKKILHEKQNIAFLSGNSWFDVNCGNTNEMSMRPSRRIAI